MTIPYIKKGRGGGASEVSPFPCTSHALNWMLETYQHSVVNMVYQPKETQTCS